MSPAQLRRRREQVAQEKTEEMAAMAYERAYRRAQVAIAQQRAKADAMRDAGLAPAKAPMQQKPRAKAGRKPPRRA